MYRILRDITKIFILPFYRLKITGKENIVLTGPIIYAANHKSMLDPFMVGFSINRDIRFLGKKELTRNPILAWIFKLIKMIPVDRDKNDIKALKTCIKSLKDGEALGIFPEGTRVKDGEKIEEKAGIGFLAKKSSAMIQPITINASYKLFSRVDVIIHPVYIVKEDEDYEGISSNVMKIIRGEKIDY